MVDSRFANRRCFLAPHRAQTYHLQQFRDRARGLSSPREVFNYTRSSLQNVVERTFGVWKKRFPIIRHMNNYQLQKQVMIPVACAVLHNFIRRSRESDELYQQFDQDRVPINIIDPSFPTEDIPRTSTTENADNHEVSVGNRSRTTADLNAFRDQLTCQVTLVPISKQMKLLKFCHVIITNLMSSNQTIQIIVIFFFTFML